MRRFPEATPCPAPNSSLSNSNRYLPNTYTSSAYASSSANYLQDDTTTATLDYTTEIKSHIRNVKPRRPRKDTAQKSTFNPAMDIFEDVALEEQQAAEPKRRARASILPNENGLRRSTILANPAQKLPIPPVPASAVHDIHPARPSRRRVSSILTDRQANTKPHDATIVLREDALEKEDRRKSVLQKDPRRRTIYVPSEDTTIVTIHPGASIHKSRNVRERSADLGLELVTLSEEEPENLVPVLKKEKKAPRKSLAIPPKRGPLQQSSRQHQMVTFAEDIIGQGSGKENVPPGMVLFESKKSQKEAPFFLTKEHRAMTTSTSTKARPTTSKLASTDVKAKAEFSRKRISSELSHTGSPSKSRKAKADGKAAPTVARHAATRKVTKSRFIPSSSPFHQDKSPPMALRRQRPERPPSKMSVPSVKQPSQGREKYAVLSEDLAQPELYEDHWLSYQEVAITQLINSLFDSAKLDANNEVSPDDLRKNMINLYHEPAIPLLHKRLQASLIYGALSIPKDLLTQTLRLKDDVGLRRKFLNLWVNTYDLTALRAAIETIVGRKIPVSSRLSAGSTSSDDGGRSLRVERRAIEGFIDTFLIRNEDAANKGVGSIASIARGTARNLEKGSFRDHHNDDFGSQGWSWRRTVLRSLMLILLLDKAKSANILPGCLFQFPSPHKASKEILQSLATMLLPSLGDVTRPLNHLNYQVRHVQYPLQEYQYHIDNLATDLRNGILLTRLVELLLYPPSTLVSCGEETVTITMPTGDVLISAFNFDQKESWVLSQHLKFPSIGRAQKLYNVQVALSALSGIKRLPSNAIAEVGPEDVVDGHREKTLSLLWALVGKWGLDSLVDWNGIEHEIARYRQQYYERQDGSSELDSDDEENTTDLEGLDLHKHLLLSWARAIARLQGFHVTNLTTTFADGKVLETIVDAYLPSTVLPFMTLSRSGHKPSLATKLKAAGCSESFISLFVGPSGSNIATTIPSRDFTLLTLAFLASRLLPLSRAHRAAQTIQRAYRVHQLRLNTSRRIVLLCLAYECKEVVNERERLAAAAIVFQRRWKSILVQRRNDLERRVLGVQSLIRGWVVRRWCGRITGGRVGSKIKERRVRGGW